MKRALMLPLVLSACDTTPPTWNDDVSVVVEQHCLACHRSGGSAPFSLATYDEAAPIASVLSDAVESGHMPPFPAAQGCQPYRGAKWLSGEEKSIFRRWADADAPLGEGPARVGAAPVRSGLTRVDVELRADEPYTPQKLVDDDDYHCASFDIGRDVDSDIVAFDVIPDQAALVHHVLLFQTTIERARAADDDEAGPGWTCFGGPGTSDFELIGAWAPGTGPVRFPLGTAIRVAADRELVMQIHYNSSSSPVVPDQTAVQLELADGPAGKLAELSIMLDTSFIIPANAVGHTFSYRRPAPFASRVWGVGAHMHTLGRSTKVSIVRAGLFETCLLDIPSWDFHHQLFYLFDVDAGLPLDAGDELQISCTWDNTRPFAAAFGEATNDEMCVAFLYLTKEDDA